MKTFATVLSAVFPQYYYRISNHSNVVGSWVVSRTNEESIHRFFDSCPFSPNNHHLVYTELPITFADELAFGNITIVNLQSGKYHVLDRTLAWASQLGAQPQWGADSHTIYYNMLEYFPSKCKEDRKQNRHVYIEEKKFCINPEVTVKAVKYNLKNHVKEYLSCPIYHISNDGEYGISPNLWTIPLTQKGYGIDWKGLEYQSNSETAGQGIYQTNLHTGQCTLLYSIQQLAAQLNLSTNDYPIYGFHTKWSYDRRYILFVLRSMHPGTYKTSWSFSRQKVRIQHLFLLTADGSKSKYLLSWASKAFQHPITKQIVSIRDGNHPNWIPQSHQISMNYQIEQETSQQRGFEIDTVTQSEQDKQWNKQHNQDKKKQTKKKKKVKKNRWSIVSFDPLKAPENLSFLHQDMMYHQEVVAHNTGKTHRNTTSSFSSSSSYPEEQTSKEDLRICPDIVQTQAPGMNNTENHDTSTKPCLLMSIVWYRGTSGHPTIHPHHRYILTDFYAKETQKQLQKSQRQQKQKQQQQQQTEQPTSNTFPPRHSHPQETSLLSPVILIDRWKEVEYGLLPMPVEMLTAETRTQPLKQRMKNTTTIGIGIGIGGGGGDWSEGIKKWLDGKEDRSWRNDYHPVWNRDYSMVAVNVLDQKTNRRQIVVIALNHTLT